VAAAEGGEELNLLSVVMKGDDYDDENKIRFNDAFEMNRPYLKASSPYCTLL
jgi:hypothetical protein